MTSIELTVQDQILWVNITQLTDKATLQQDLAIALGQLDAQDQLNGGELIGINGASTLMMAYALAEFLSPRYQVIAVYDPKLRSDQPQSAGMGTYIVVKSELSDYPIGHLLTLPDSSVAYPIKLVICGPPHAGKSCLRNGLKQALQTQHLKQRSPYPFVFEACPDGEGSWYAETYQRHERLAKSLRAKYKRDDFSENFVRETAQMIKNITLPLTLIDLGGAITAANRQIAADATHGIILWRDRLPEQEYPRYATLTQWQQFCQETHLDLIAEIKSDRHATQDQIICTHPKLVGISPALERGAQICDRPLIQALCRAIIQRCEGYHHV